MAIQRIVIGVDGSSAAERALRWAVDLARATGAEVVAVHAVGLLAHLDADRVLPAATHRDELEDAVGRWCRLLEESDVSCRRLLVDGTPWGALLDTARDEDADLIVVGARGVGLAPERMLGSTSQRVVQLSTLPVTVVPVPAEGGTG